MADHHTDWETLDKWCSETSVVEDNGTYDLQGNSMTVFGQCRARALEGQFSAGRILSYMPHLNAEFIELVGELERCDFFTLFDSTHQMIIGQLQNLQVLSTALVDYRERCYKLADLVAPYLGDRPSVHLFGQSERSLYVQTHPASDTPIATMRAFKLG